MKAILLGIILCMISVTGFLFIPSSGSGDEQKNLLEPEILYRYPEESIGGAREFQADVHEGTIHIVGSYRYLRDERYLEDSKIFYLQQKGVGQPDVQLLPPNNYPTERPSLLLDRYGTVHFLWGDRRLDPDFEEWNTERIQWLGFSTNVVYSRYDGTRFTAPESILEGHLRVFGIGVGDILLPAQWVEDSQGQLHTVFIAGSPDTLTTPDGEDVVDVNHKTTYLIRSPAGEWSPSLFLQPGKEPASLSDIAVLPNGRLVVAYLGSVPTQRSVNDVLVLTSEDGGSTWSDPQLVFLSGQQPGWQLGLKTGPDGTVHLVWGRQTRGLPVPNELWHSYSEDGGDSWSPPERFFIPEQTAQNENFIESFDLAVDQSGQLHCMAVEVNLQQSDGTLFYATWNPQTKSWEPAEIPILSEAPRRNADLALDETTGKLYLFWDEAEDDAIYYSVKESSEPMPPPVIAHSGPLQLHANYPNPFNPTTRISFTLEEPADVALRIYDMSGRQIMEEKLGTKPAGLLSEEINLTGLTSGTYIYEVALNDTWRQQSTMTFIK